MDKGRLTVGFALTMAALCAGAAEVLVDFENSRVERWTVEGGTWRKSGVFLDGKAAKLKPFGLAVAGGKVYVSCVQDGKTGTIEEYAPDGTHLRTLAKLDYNPQMMAVSPDGKWLCVTAYSRVVRRHSVEDGRCETLCPGAPLYTRGIKFGPDGNLYLSSTYYGTIAVYDTNARAIRPDQIGTITTYGCHSGFDFGGEGLDRLVVPADLYESVDLFAGTSDVRYPQEPRMHWCISTVRVGGEVFAADHGKARIVHVPATPAPVTVVAEGLVGGISSMVNLTEALDGSEAKRFAAAKARIVAAGKKVFTGVPKLLGGVRDLERMGFNNPDLTVDLSCGIWPDLRICDTCVAIGSTSVPRQGVLRFDRIDPYLYKAPVETTWGEAPRRKKRGRDPGYSYPDCDCAHFRGNRGFERYFADMDGDGLDDCVEIVNDWTEYGVPGPACPVAYDADEKWTNNHIQAFAYVFFREGKGKDGRWGEPKKVPCDGKPDLQSPYGTGGAVFGDFDGDGDTDMITGDFRSEIWFFENIGTKDAPAFAKGRHPVDPDGKAIEGDLCMMTIQGDDWDGDGLVDLVASEEDGRISVFRNAGRTKDGVPVFEAQRFLKQKAGDLKFGCLSTPFAVDWDGDGDQDFIAGNSGGYIAFIENLSGPGVEYPKWAEPKLFTVKDPENCTAKYWLRGNVIQARCGDENSPQGPAEAKWGYTVLSVADWDGDGFLDIMANDVKGSVVLIRNPGKTGTTVMEAPKAVEVEWEGEQPRFAWEWRKPTGRVLRAPWRTTPLMYDWTGDGLVDLIMVDAERHLSLYERAKAADGRLVLRHPKPLLHDMGGRPVVICGEKGGCGRRKICITDWDGDGRPDIIINGGNFYAFLNKGEKDGKTVFEETRQLARKRLSGHTNCPTVVDFNGDGIPDIVSGAEDGHFYYLRNSRSAEDGRNWTVRLPENPKPWEVTAAADVEDYVGRRLGGNAFLVGGLERPVFHVGDTAFAKEKGLDSKTLEDERWVIRSFGRDVVLNGGGRHGCLYAVSHFLEDFLGVRWWGEMDEDVPSPGRVSLGRLDATGRPKFAYRDIYRSMDAGRASTRLAIRRRLNRNGDILCTAAFGGGYSYGPPAHAHTFNMYVPWEKYGKEHPEWFSVVKGKRHGGGGFADGGQLCFANVAGFRELFLRNVLKNIDEASAAAKAQGLRPPEFYEISMNDNQAYCECDGCKALAEKYGKSGVYLNFVNDMAAEIGKRHPEVYVTMLAYFFTEEAPKGGVKPADNVIIKLCNTRANMAVSVLHPDNGIFRDLVETWQPLAKNVFIWDYDITYTKDSTGYPFPSEFHYADKYRYLLSHGVKGIFWEHEEQDTSDFYDLKYYLKTKLFEDPDVDYPRLLVEAFNDYFGKLAGPHVLAARRRLVEAQKRNKGCVRWFPSLSEFNYIRLADADFMLAEYEAAAKAVGENGKVLRRLNRAKDGLARLVARRAPLLNRHGPDARGPARFAPPPELKGRSFWDFYATDFTLFDKSEKDVKLVDEPASPIGKAVRISIGTKGYEMPFLTAYYDPAAKKESGHFNISASDVRRGAYHWYPCGTITPSTSGMIFLTRQWTTQVALPSPDFAGKTYQLMIHAKFEKSQVLVDRVVLLDKPAAGTAK